MGEPSFHNVSKDSAGALSSIRVLDCSHVRAGPVCVRQLADFGADVIKIESPDHLERGELYVGERDGADMQNLHRNKRSITINLKTDKGREAFEKLVKDADVVVENFRPSVKERLGLDYESLARMNPRIILTSISGFGQDGPRSQDPGYDQVIQGMCGLMSATGFDDGPPLRAGAAVIDVSTGLYAAIGTLTALVERGVSGKGQWVQTSLLHSGIGLMDFQAARYSMDGQVARRVGNDHPTTMPTSTYPTQDGHINIGVGNDRQWRVFCSAIGEAELASDPRFASAQLRSDRRAELNEQLTAIFRRKPTAAWCDALMAAGIPSGPIYSMDEVFHDPQVKHAEMFWSVDHPRRGPISIVAQPVKLTRTPATACFCLEDKGASNSAILEKLGYSADEVAQFVASGAA